MASKKTPAGKSTAGLVTIELSKQGTNVLEFKARIDGADVSFSRAKTATVAVARGEEHVLDWFAKGTEGQTYSLEITRPLRMAFLHKATLDADRRDSGHHRFTL